MQYRLLPAVWNDHSWQRIDTTTKKKKKRFFPKPKSELRWRESTPWLFLACNVWSGCRPSAFHKVWAGTRWVKGCTGVPEPSSASRRVVDRASPAPRTLPVDIFKNNHIHINKTVKQWNIYSAEIFKSMFFIPSLHFAAHWGLYQVPPEHHLPFYGGSGENRIRKIRKPNEIFCLLKLKQFLHKTIIFGYNLQCYNFQSLKPCWP